MEVAGIREIREAGRLADSCIANADQSGFQKQLISGCFMSPKGVKKVESLVKSESSTTHSYTVFPLIFADGRLSSKLVAVFPEPEGKFPQRSLNTTSNIMVKSYTPHIMTEKHMVG